VGFPVVDKLPDEFRMEFIDKNRERFTPNESQADAGMKTDICG